MKESTYSLKQMSVDDLAELDEIMKLGHFNWGVFNWLCCFYASPETFFFVVDNKTGQRIGVYTENRMTDSFIYGHTIVILPQYRSKGVMHWIYRRFESTDEEKKVENISDNKSQVVLAKLGLPFIIGHKIIEYGGYARKILQTQCKNSTILIKRVENEEGVQKLVMFDSQLYSKINLSTEKRARFIAEWAFSEYSNSVLAERNHVVEGFGTIRKRASSNQDGQYEYLLCPVYAMNDETGRKILEELIQFVPENKYFCLQFPSDNRTSLQFCKDHGLTFTYAEYRTYTRKLMPLPLTNIFSSHDFWPF